MYFRNNSQKIAPIPPRFSRKEAIAIRQAYFSGSQSYRGLARSYQCSTSTINHVIRAKGAYKWLNG